MSQLRPKLPGRLSIPQASGCRRSTEQRPPPSRGERQRRPELMQRLLRTIQIQEQLAQLLAGRNDWTRCDRQFFNCVLLICGRAQAGQRGLRVAVRSKTPGLGFFE